MQRIAPNTMPPRSGSKGNGGNTGQTDQSPALRMAGRIRMEQGQEQAARYLAAMEPFLAPAERQHIARQLGLPLSAPQPAPRAQVDMGPAGGPNGFPGGSAQQNMPAGGLGNMGNMLQMMQMLQGLMGAKGMPAGQSGGPGMGNPLQMMQMLGSLLQSNK